MSDQATPNANQRKGCKMNARLSLITVGVVLFILFAAGTNFLYSAPLTPKDEQTIKTAYMNGFVAAIQMDNETIKTLKRDEPLLKQTVEKAANGYLRRVKEMNK
jgi:hypothetical protein